MYMFIQNIQYTDYSMSVCASLSLSLKLTDEKKIFRLNRWTSALERGVCTNEDGSGVMEGHS